MGIQRPASADNCKDLAPEDNKKTTGLDYVILEEG